MYSTPRSHKPWDALNLPHFYTTSWFCNLESPNPWSFRSAVLLSAVYDVTRRETFEHLSYWLKEVCRVGSHPDTIRMIVGNKLDLVTPSPVNSSSLPHSDFSILGEDPDNAPDDNDRDPGSCDFSDCGGGSSGYREGGGSGSRAPLKAAAAERQVSAEEAAAFAREHGCMYAEMSARRDHNVHDSLAWGVICAVGGSSISGVGNFAIVCV